MRAGCLALVLISACARSALPLGDEQQPAAVGGKAAAPESIAGSSAPRCAKPESPVALPAGCEQAMCACDRAAFSSCDWECWSKVACQVATCNNNPTRIECAEGCPNATEAELRLGRCYETSRACTQFR